MAQLMIVPIRDKSDAVLIVSLCEGEAMVGYVTKRTLKNYVQRDLTNCDGLSIVRRNLELFETLLASKFKHAEQVPGSTPCLEITLSDLKSGESLLSEDFLDLREWQRQ